MLDDEELIRRISKKDQASFEQLVHRYQSLVLNICYGLLGDFHQAEEAAQDVFVQVFRKAATFRYESRVSTWIYRIAVNLSLNMKRRDRISPGIRNIDISRLDKYPLGKKTYDSHQKEPAALLEQKESMRLLRKAVDNLPDKMKTAFVLNQIEGFSAEETAEILGVSMNTVEVRIHRAKRKLKSILISKLKM